MTDHNHSLFELRSTHSMPIICQPANDNARTLIGDDVGITTFSTQSPEAPPQAPIALRAWLDLEALTLSRSLRDLDSQANVQTVDVFKKLTVAFAIGKLIQHLAASVSGYSQSEIVNLFDPDNFAVHMLPSNEGGKEREVTGIELRSPPVQLQVKRNMNDIEAVVTRHSPCCCAKQHAHEEQADDSSMCFALGVLVQLIFSGTTAITDAAGTTVAANESYETATDLSPNTKFKSVHTPPERNEESSPNSATLRHVSGLVRDLLSCKRGDGTFQINTAPISLDLAIRDLYLMLMMPDRFLSKSCPQLEETKSIHGRYSESGDLLLAFERVARSGQCEAFFVKGGPGSGKTYLVVQSLFAAAHAFNGLVVMKKFEKNCDQVSLVLSVFNDLCTQLGGLANLWQDLHSEFGSDEFKKLVGALPDVMKLAPHHESKGSFTQVTSEKLSLISLCGIMKRFLRLISTPSRPILLILDDIHWSNTESLEFLHALLTDQRKVIPMFLVGCYLIEPEGAANATESQGIVPAGTGDEHCLHGFDQWLLASKIPVRMVRLGHMSEEDVNSMISESLSMLPRLCHSLAQVIFCKTGGNPLQICKVLRSLVEKGLLHYSLLQMSWVWDINKICDEFQEEKIYAACTTMDIEPNVASNQEFIISRQLESGRHLFDLMEKIECEMNQPTPQKTLHIYYQAVLTLSGKELKGSSSQQLDEPDYVFSQIMSLTYLGYYERVRHMFKRWELLNGKNQCEESFESIYVSFYYGISSFGQRRKKNARSKRIPESTKKWLDVVQRASKCSKWDWNWQNKASLLMAEKHSLANSNDEAEAEYDASIRGAQSSGFIHEEALACELAGAHYERLKESAKALSMFHRAENCYERWGSVPKARKMKDKINSHSYVCLS